MTVALEILNQLGGNKFIAMTGARNLQYSANNDTFLSFRIPGNITTAGINHVRVTLDPSDTYTVTFSKIRGTTVKQIAQVDGVYCDMLQTVFCAETGLHTSL